MPEKKSDVTLLQMSQREPSLLNRHFNYSTTQDLSTRMAAKEVSRRGLERDLEK